MLAACLCLLSITVIACTPKDTNNAKNQESERSEIVRDFSYEDNNRNEWQERKEINGFVIMGDELAAYFGSTRNLTIPEDLEIKRIGSEAFSHCSITSLLIPKEIVFINYSAFENCHSLQSITVDEENEEYASVDGVLYNKEITELIYYPHGKTGDFSIPDTITKLEIYAFSARSDLTSINIPSSITGIIGSDVFDNTTRLTSINVDPNNKNYTSVDGVLFNKSVTDLIHFPNNKAGSYTIPNTVKELRDNVFRSRKGLTSVTIPNGIKGIGKEAFYMCSNLERVDLPGSITSIGERAFYNCSKLTSITLNEGLVSIGEQAFTNCKALSSINIPASVTKIEGKVFLMGESYWLQNDGYSENSSLASITVDPKNRNYASVDGVLFNKNISELIHFPQGKEGSYSIPKTVNKIEKYAFSNRGGLTSITIPANITDIGKDAFFGCSNLTSIEVDQNNRNYSSADGVLFNKSKSELIRYPRGKNGSYTIPNTVKTIGDNAFASAKGLTSVTIPSSVTDIGDTAFADTGLKTLTLPNSITDIGYGAFTDNSDLEIVNLPDGFYSDDDYGKGDPYYFYGCVNLKKIIAGKNNKYYSTVDGVLLSKNKKELIRYPQGKQGSYTIPGSVTSIAYKAFYKCERLVSVKIPKSVKNIGDFAFDGSGITTLDIPNSVTGIGKYAFTRCLRLASVNIPSSVASIGDFAFYNCTALSEFNVDQNNKNFLLVNGVLLNKKNKEFICVIHTTPQDSLVAR